MSHCLWSPNTMIMVVFCVCVCTRMHVHLRVSQISLELEIQVLVSQPRWANAPAPERPILTLLLKWVSHSPGLIASLHSAVALQLSVAPLSSGSDELFFACALQVGVCLITIGHVNSISYTWHSSVLSLLNYLSPRPKTICTLPQPSWPHELKDTECLSSHRFFISCLS